MFLLLIWLPPGCGGSGGSPDGDMDLEPYSEWEREIETETDGDEEIEGYERFEEPPYTNDSVRDEPFGQWYARSYIGTEDSDEVPVQVNAILPWVNGGAYIGAENGLWRWDPTQGEDGKLYHVDNPDGFDDFPVYDLVLGYDNRMFIISMPNPNPDDISLFSMRAEDYVRPEPLCELFVTPKVLAAKGSSRQLYIGTSGGIYYYSGTSCSQENDWPVGYIVDLLAGEDDNVTLLTRGSETDTLHILRGQWLAFTPEEGLLSSRLRAADLAADGSGDIWLGFEAGVQKLNFRLEFEEPPPLPWEDVQDIAVAPDGNVWAATEKGVLRYDPAAESGRWQLFHSHRWMENDDVIRIGFDREGDVWLGHANGVTRLYRKNWTLKDKADFYHDKLYGENADASSRHFRMGGYATVCDYSNPGRPESDCVPRMDDEEALRTGLHALMETFRGVAAKDAAEKEEARSMAWRSVERLLELERGTQVPGLTAISVLPRGEGPVSDPSQGEWNRSDDYDWKGDPGFEALFGHVLAYPLYHEILADADRKAEIEDVFHKIAKHIVDYDYRMYDLDNQPTERARWDMEAVFGTALGEGNGGLAALELLALLRGAYAVTGDDAFLRAYLDRADTKNYANRTKAQHSLSDDRKRNHFYNLLAFTAFLPLLRYEDYTRFRQVYVDSLKGQFNAVKSQKNPLYTVLYGAFVHNDFGLSDAVEALRLMRPDVTDWRVDTCWRMDVEQAATAAGEALEITTVLPPDERRLLFLGGNPYACGWEGEEADKIGGYVEDDGLNFLLAYWAGRFFKMIEEPEDAR